MALTLYHAGFPDSSGGKESACNVGHPGSIPGLGRSTGEGIGYPFQYSWAGKESACNAGDLGSIPGLGRFPREAKVYPLQYSGLNSMDCIKSSSVQFSSVTQSCLTLCNPMNCSTPGLPVHHQLLEFTQTHVHRVGDAIQPSHSLSSPSPPAPNPSQHQSLFQ